MAGDGRGTRSGFDRPRVLIAGALTSVLILLLLVDAFSADYAVTEVTQAALLGAICTLLGIEALDFLRRGP